MQLENRLSNEVGEKQTFSGLKESKGNLLAFLERDVVVSKLNPHWTVWFEPWALQWVLLIDKALNSFSIFHYSGVHVGAGEKMGEGGGDTCDGLGSDLVASSHIKRYQLRRWKGHEVRNIQPNLTFWIGIFVFRVSIFSASWSNMELEDKRARDQGRLKGMSAIDLCLYDM